MDPMNESLISGLNYIKNQIIYVTELGNLELDTEAETSIAS